MLTVLAEEAAEQAGCCSSPALVGKWDGSSPPGETVWTADIWDDRNITCSSIGSVA